MIANPRRPLYGLNNRQIGWEIATEDLLSHGVVPVTPSDCPWYREDGMPHACVTGLGDDLCEEMVVLRADAVVCVRGMVLGADA